MRPVANDRRRTPHCGVCGSQRQLAPWGLGAGPWSCTGSPGVPEWGSGADCGGVRNPGVKGLLAGVGVIGAVGVSKPGSWRVAEISGAAGRRSAGCLGVLVGQRCEGWGSGPRGARGSATGVRGLGINYSTLTSACATTHNSSKSWLGVQCSRRGQNRRGGGP